MREEKFDPLRDELPVEEAPLSWSLSLNDLPQEGIEGEMRANSNELLALTKMLNDEHELEVKSFVCSYHVRPGTVAADKDVGGCLIQGCKGQFEIRAELRQTCVVTLERIETQLVESFEQEFSTKGGQRPTVIAIEGEGEDPFATEPPMKLIKGKAQLGPLVYQYLSMAIDTNPRKPGAEFEEKQARGSEIDDKPPSPFMVLKNIRPKK